jgi:hypothetical protein
MTFRSLLLAPTSCGETQQELLTELGFDQCLIFLPVRPPTPRWTLLSPDPMLWIGRGCCL